MKRILYITIGVICLGCSYKKQPLKTTKDTVYIAPDGVRDTTECFHRIDSVERKLKAHSYEMYGDSNMMNKIVTEGLPDSMKLHNP